MGFALSYSKTIADTNIREISSAGDFYTMPQIMDFNGLRWGDYDEKDAVVIAKQLIADNKQEFGHSEEDKIHPKAAHLEQVLLCEVRRDDEEAQDREDRDDHQGD